MISIISTGALTVNTRGSLLHLEKEKIKREVSFGGGGGVPKGVLTTILAGSTATKNIISEKHLKLLYQQQLLVSVWKGLLARTHELISRHYLDSFTGTIIEKSYKGREERQSFII